MKWNIFERLNTLEKELHELRETVRFQGNTIISLQLQNIEEEGLKLIENLQETNTERRRRQKREYYARNKKEIAERRKIKNKLEEAKQNGDIKKSYYWKNVNKRRAYNRDYYQKKKLATQVNK
jgi:uncharacterized protein (DUF342 family)